MKAKVITPSIPAEAEGKNPFYLDLLKQTHIFVAGCTGSGKSVVVNSLITIALYDHPGNVQFILIDPKRVELSKYKHLPHVLQYASSKKPGEMIKALQYAVWLMEYRFDIMEQRGEDKFTGGADVYIIIDELADLMTTDKAKAEPLIQRIAQLGRAARIHCICCTQTLHSSVISGPIKVNFPATVALHTREALHSRMIMGCNGCEDLPDYGQGYYVTPSKRRLINIPMLDAAETRRLIDHWSNPENCVYLDEATTTEIEQTPQETAPAADSRTAAERKKDTQKALLKRIFGH